MTLLALNPTPQPDDPHSESKVDRSNSHTTKLDAEDSTDASGQARWRHRVEKPCDTED